GRYGAGLTGISRYCRTVALFCSSSDAEKILAPNRLTVLPVLDLDPGRRFRRVLGACLLRDNPLHVSLADNTEQVQTAREVIHVQNRLRWARKQLPQECLPLRQG